MAKIGFQGWFYVLIAILSEFRTIHCQLCSGVTTNSCKDKANSTQCAAVGCCHSSFLNNENITVHQCGWPTDCTSWLSSIASSGGVSLTTVTSVPFFNANRRYHRYSGDHTWREAMGGCGGKSNTAGCVGRLAWIPDQSVEDALKNSLLTPGTQTWIGAYKWLDADLRWMHNGDTPRIQANWWGSGSVLFDDSKPAIYWDNGVFGSKASYEKVGSYLCEYICSADQVASIDFGNPATFAPSSGNCGAGWYRHENAYCYKDLDESDDYGTSEYKCRAVGGHLPTFGSVTEQLKFYTTRITDYNAGFAINGYVWIGATDHRVDGTAFSWQDHRLEAILPASNWVGGVIPTSVTFPDHCVVEYGSTVDPADRGKFKVTDCYDEHAILCQKYIEPSLDTLCGPGGILFGKSCFKVITVPDSWSNAMAICAAASTVSITGRLAWFVSEATFTNVMVKLGSQVASADGLFYAGIIGLKNNTAGGSTKMYWHSDASTAVELLGHGWPRDQFGDLGDSSFPCVLVHKDGSGHQKSDCTTTAPFVCEYRLTADSPSIAPTTYTEVGNHFYMMSFEDESCDSACSRRGGTCPLDAFGGETAEKIKHHFLRFGIDCTFDYEDRFSYEQPAVMWDDDVFDLQGICFGVLGNRISLCEARRRNTRRLCKCKVEPSSSTCYQDTLDKCTAEGGLMHDASCYIHKTTLNQWTPAHSACRKLEPTNENAISRLGWFPYENDWNIVRDNLLYASGDPGDTYIGLRKSVDWHTSPDNSPKSMNFIYWWKDSNSRNRRLGFHPDQFGWNSDFDLCFAVMGGSQSKGNWTNVACEHGNFKAGYLCQLYCHSGCGFNYQAKNDICYHAADEMTWHSAAYQVCPANDGMLPSFQSDTEYDSFVAFRKSQYWNTQDKAWLGAFDFHEKDEVNLWNNIDVSDAYIANRLTTSTEADYMVRPRNHPLATCSYCKASNYPTWYDVNLYPDDPNKIPRYDTFCQKRKIDSSQHDSLVKKVYCRVLGRCPDVSQLSEGKQILRSTHSVVNLMRYLLMTKEFSEKLFGAATDAERGDILHDAIWARDTPEHFGSYGSTFSSTPYGYFPLLESIFKRIYRWTRRYSNHRVPGDGRMNCSCVNLECPKLTDDWYRAPYGRCYYKLMSVAYKEHRPAEETCHKDAGHPYAELPMVNNLQDLNEFEWWRKKMSDDNLLSGTKKIWFDGFLTNNTDAGLKITYSDGSPFGWTIWAPDSPTTSLPTRRACILTSADHRLSEGDCLSPLASVACQVCASFDECPQDKINTTEEPVKELDCRKIHLVYFYSAMVPDGTGAVVLTNNATLDGQLANALNYLSGYRIDPEMSHYLVEQFSPLPITTTLSPNETTEAPSTVAVTMAPSPVSSLQASDRLAVLVNENGSVSALPMGPEVFLDRIMCELDPIGVNECPDGWLMFHPHWSKCYQMFRTQAPYVWDDVVCVPGSTRFVPPSRTELGGVVLEEAFWMFIYNLGFGLVCPAGWFAIGDDCYMWMTKDSKISYEAANSSCLRNNSRVPMFDNKDHFSRMSNFVTALHATTGGGSLYNDVVVGLDDIVQETRWHWITGELAMYDTESTWFFPSLAPFAKSDLWASGHPVTNDGTHVAVMSPAKGGKLIDYPKSSVAVLCQRTNAKICADIKYQTTTSSYPSTTTEEPWPLTGALYIAAIIFQILGCSSILGSIGFTIALFVVLRDWSVERCIHLGQEIGIAGGHILVLTMRDIVQVPTLCRVAGMGFQYFFIVAFLFMFLESLQFYAILTNVISMNGFLSRRKYLLVGFIIPAVLVFFTAVDKFDDYLAKYSCWLNLGERIATDSIFPIIVLSAMTIIVTEAAAMKSFEKLPVTDPNQLFAAQVNQKGLLLVLASNFGSWFVGLFTVYYVRFSLYFTVFVLNVVLACAIVAFHTMGNPKAHEIVVRLLKKYCCKRSK